MPILRQWHYVTVRRQASEAWLPSLTLHQRHSRHGLSLGKPYGLPFCQRPPVPTPTSFLVLIEPKQFLHLFPTWVESQGTCNLPSRQLPNKQNNPTNSSTNREVRKTDWHQLGPPGQPQRRPCTLQRVCQHGLWRQKPQQAPPARSVWGPN